MLNKIFFELIQVVLVVLDLLLKKSDMRNFIIINFSTYNLLFKDIID